jgi:ATP-dependent helicase/nuclease subunit B
LTKAQDRRVWLGWDKPIITGVVEHLVRGRATGPGEPLDLEDLLIVVPTRQAGRRLREALACWCDEHDTSLLSAKVVTPNYFFGASRLPVNIPTAAAVRMFWTDVLMNADLAELGAIFPGLSDERSFAWALNTAEIFESLRQELSDAAMTISDVAEQHADQLEELDRWQELAALEQMYMDRLAREQLVDICAAKIASAAHAAQDLDAASVVLAAVPDPSLLAIAALSNIAENIDLDILVHAPEARKSDFDNWGRPKPGSWLPSQIEIPDFDDNVFLEATPAEQSQRLLREIDREQARFESGEIAIGVPDTTIIPFLKKDMGSVGLPPFDPSDQAVADHRLGRLAQALLAVVQVANYEAVAALIRHPDVAAFLERVHGLEMLKVLGQLDEFQNYYLPINLHHMLAPFNGNERGTSEPRDDFTELGKALAAVNKLRAIFEGGDFAAAWRLCFRTVYSGRLLNRTLTRDAQFEGAAMALDEVLREFQSVERLEHGLTIPQLSAIFVNRLRCATFHGERHDEVVDLEGWLELAWNDHPLLLVTGVNDDFVPGGSLSDAFLPDSLRHKLGLRDDRVRFARDVYLLTTMIESRRLLGRTCLIAGKTGMSGDPLKPSRLLFRCPDAELPARVQKLLSPVRDTRPRPAPEVIFQLRPDDAERTNNIPEDGFISVTAFRDYLECPFRFYLKHILQMEPCDDQKTGLDHLDFGIIVHEVMRVMGRDKALWGCDDPDKLGQSLGALAEQYVHKRFGSPLPLSVHISLMSAMQRLTAVAREQVALVAAGWDIIEAEAGEDKATRDRWRLKRDGFTISGRIDRIDRHRESGQIRIIDYKTSDSAKMPVAEHIKRRKDDTPDWNKLTKTKERAKGPTTEFKRWVDLQLPLYALIYAQDGSVAPETLELAYFNLPKAVSATGVYRWKDLTPEVIKSAETCMDGVLQSIRSGVFWPPAKSVTYDDFEELFNSEPDVGLSREGLVP